MKVDILEALFSSVSLYVVGSYLFWVNKMIITLTANSIFGRFQRQGADDKIRRRIEEWKKKKEEERRMEEEEDEDEDLPAVQVIDDVGKKCH